MSSLREIRELLVDFYMNGVLSDEEFVVLYYENRSKNRLRSYGNQPVSI